MLYHLDERMDRLEARINYLLGALGVLVVVANVAVGVVVALAVAGGGAP